MLIPYEQIAGFCIMSGKPIRGILHIGAHECEEKEAYNSCGISDEAIYWIDGNSTKISEMKEKYPSAHLYTALIDDAEREVTFYITNNGQSSSILPLETHAQHYPTIVVSEQEVRKTTTLQSLFEKENIPVDTLNFWNLDIQGVELSALKSAGDSIKHADAIYTEVNIESLYKGCALLPELDAFLKTKGFERVAIKLMPQGWGDALYVRKSE